MLLVEVLEQSLPCLFGAGLARQLHHALTYQCISLCLVVPAVLHPQSGVSVPCGNARSVNPCHPARVYALALANRLVRTYEELRLLRIELAEEQSLALHSLVEQLYGGGRSEVRVLPCPQLPHYLTLLVNLHCLHGRISGVHRSLVPLVVPVVYYVVAVLQAHRLLWLCNAKLGGIHLPHHVSLAVNLLYKALSAGNEQVALRQLLHRPWQETRPAIHLLSVAVILMYAAQRHVGYEQGAALRKACAAELSVY